MIPIALVCGCGHTGTTLLANMLAAHSQIFVPLYEPRLYLKAQKIGGKSAATLDQRLLRDLQALGAQAGARWIVDKTPQHVNALEPIRGLFPANRFVLMVRDPKDVIASLFLTRRKPGQARYMYQGDLAYAMWWWQCTTSQVAVAQAYDEVVTVRYEDLIERPAVEVARVCEHLGIEYEPEIRNYHTQERLWFGETKVEDGPGHRQHRNWQANQPIFDGRGRWRELIEKDLGTVLEFLRENEGLVTGFGYSLND